mmetsp:Transcript_37621/g.95013  ORF Transcript_37621/g.95013 Transcript_37621/m.95013 type:complete len:244 (-) Transcript_37621:1144-1875(-)
MKQQPFTSAPRGQSTSIKSRKVKPWYEIQSASALAALRILSSFLLTPSYRCLASQHLPSSSCPATHLPHLTAAPYTPTSCWPATAAAVLLPAGAASTSTRSPMRLYALQWLMRTHTSLPRSASPSPSKYTSLLWRMRPNAWPGLRGFTPSTSTSSVRPWKRCARSVATSMTTALRRLRRSALMRSATWLSQVAAGVLGRGEYAAVLTRSKPTSRTSASVARYCSSLSPGNPTITSPEMEASGM